jgi:PIN domain nuclease of toxin-antitoxin system
VRGVQAHARETQNNEIEQLHAIRPYNCFRRLPSCLQTGGFHEKLDQGVELGSMVCKHWDGRASARGSCARASVSVCLDSWAILAWLDDEEPALSRVEGLIDTRPIVSWVNLVEVYYRVERDHGRIAADDTLTSLRAALSLDLPGTARMIETARLKARALIPLGDCFAVATAAAHGLVLLTGDPEILELPDSPCTSEDLRPR